MGYYLWMYFVFSVLPSCKHKIIVLVKHRCVEFTSIKLRTMSKSNQKIEKKHNYSCAWKSYSTSRTGIGGRKKKEVIINSKTTTLSHLSGKRSNKIKVVNIFTFYSWVNSDWMIILPSPVYVRLPSQKYFTASAVLKILSF